MKKIALLFLIATGLFAEEALPINPPERPILEKGCNLWIRADLLLWNAQEENLTYCATSRTSSHVERNLLHPEAKLEWGYRLEFGYNTPHDGWDIELQYTEMHNVSRGSIKKQGSREIFETLLPNSSFEIAGTIDRAHSKWKVKLNQLDLLLGREYATGRHFTLRPYGGARSTWIYQNFNTSYDFHGGDVQRILQKDQFWGFGFTCGLATNWGLGWGFSLYGDAGYALLLGCFDIAQKGKHKASTQWDFGKSFRSGKSVLDIDLGLKWGKVFAEGDWAMAFKVGYEYHLYFNQNQFLTGRGTAAFPLTAQTGGDLAYQGVVFSGQFDF